MSQKEYRNYELAWSRNKIVEALDVLDKIADLNPKNQDLLVDAQWHLYSALLKIKQLKRNLR